MLHLTVLTSAAAMMREFGRCCRRYSAVHIASAWCGDPDKELPYSHLEGFNGKITATIGASFNQTHPEAIALLRSLKADVRIFRDEVALFHPKLYLFSSGKQVALFVGSSNLTYSGFTSNIEANVLLEGTPSTDEAKEVGALRKQLAEWHSNAFSSAPSNKWLKKYKAVYAKTLRAEKKARIRTARQSEAEIGSAGWLRDADWHVFYAKVNKALQQHTHKRDGYLAVLDAARNYLQLPWKRAYFNDPQCRRVIAGIRDYAWLGHVGASGKFRHLLAAGTANQQQAIVNTVNSIASLGYPIGWNQLAQYLRRLVKLGPTMKVWSRVLCLVRPDLYPTVASQAVRKNLGQTLKIPQNRFETPDGYIQLVKLIHGSPWFQSPKPVSGEERQIWLRRAAFIDAIFHS